MGKPFIIYNDEIIKSIEDENTNRHNCIFCKKTYICLNLEQWHFCNEGYHGIGKNFICLSCLTQGLQSI
uniref:Uncharacterized protein n=1 Tax=viral metagenome TaxID=1070528 RepID=A0A6C0JC55_9ZZZZ